VELDALCVDGIRSSGVVMHVNKVHSVATIGCVARDLGGDEDPAAGRRQQNGPRGRPFRDLAQFSAVKNALVRSITGEGERESNRGSVAMRSALIFKQ
jgi:hypothetical protein